MEIQQPIQKQFVLDNFKEVYSIYTELFGILESIKADSRLSGKGIDGITKYSSYKRYKPYNIYDVMEKYPINIFPNMYKITLAKEASEIIKETDLLDSDVIEIISFIKNGNEEESNIGDEQQQA